MVPDYRIQFFSEQMAFERPRNAFVDPGAEISLISDRLASELQSAGWAVALDWPTVQLVDFAAGQHIALREIYAWVSGEADSLEGVVALPLRIVCFVVVPVLPGDVLLGLDAIGAWRVAPLVLVPSVTQAREWQQAYFDDFARLQGFHALTSRPVAARYADGQWAQRHMFRISAATAYGMPH